MKKATRVKNSILNVITGLSGQMFVLLLKFVTRTVFISVLGKSFLGINGLFSDILSMLSLTELGLDTAINFKLYKPLAEGDWQRVRILMKFYRNAYHVVGLTILGLGICLIPLLPFVINDYDSLEGLGINAAMIFFLYLMQSVSSYLFFASRSAIVKADQREYILNFAGYAVTLTTNIAQILILVFLQDFILYTVVVVAFNILQNLINAMIAKRCYPQAFSKTDDKISRAEVKEIFGDLGALFIYKINSVVLKATDNIVLSSFIGLAIVGVYSNYLMFYTGIKNLLGRFYNAVKASMGNLFAVAEMEKRYLFFEVMNLISVILYGTAGVGVAVVADEVVQSWIGTEYVIAQPFAVLMGIEILFVGFKSNLGQIRNVTGTFRQMWFRPLLGIVINIVVSVLLVRPFGIYGVVIGTITADILTNFLVDPTVIHKYSFEGYRPVSVYYRKNLQYILVLAGTGVLNYGFCTAIFSGHGWWSVIFHALFCGVSVPLVFFLLFRKTPEFIYLLGIYNKLKNKTKLKKRDRIKY